MDTLEFMRWCAIAVAGIKYKPDRNRVYDELYAHLEDRCAAMTEATIPDGVKKIAPYALNGTTTDPAGGEEGTQVDWYLVEVVIPDSVTEIGKNAFAHCHNLERVTIGNGVTTIPHECFWDDYELRTVNFGKKVRVIGDYAFHDTWLPGDLVIPDSVVSIGKQAFHNDEISLGASWVEDDLFPNKTIRP